MSTPSLGKAVLCRPPPAATNVGSQSIDMIGTSLRLPGPTTSGQRTIAGMRRPPSSSSVFLPVNGQVSLKRSPPLSLVNTTIVSRSSPSSASLASTRPMLSSSDFIILA